MRPFMSRAGHALVAAALAGCAVEENLTHGTVELALTEVPADVSCLRLTVTGSRTVTRSYDVTPGAPTAFTLDRLPLGLVSIDGQAYARPCAAVSPAHTPAFLGEKPVVVRLDASAIAKALLRLVRNGRLAVDVDFEKSPGWLDTSKRPLTLAVIGDSPYGPAQFTDFPGLVSHINADPEVTEVVHVGDIKNGSSRCDTSYFQSIAAAFATFADPLIFTPGDNEWTDCHRANNGAYDPIERLQVLRQLFYPQVGQSLGASKREVFSQAALPGFETFVENQLWEKAGVILSAVHVVGSNNGRAVWFGDDKTGTKMDDPGRRLAEVAARTSAALAWIDLTFDLALQDAAQGVVIFMQADTWDAGAIAAGAPQDGLTPVVQRLADRARAFGKPVLVVQGDSHVYLADSPLVSGDPVHGVAMPVPNLRRVVVEGATTAEWLKLVIDPTVTDPAGLFRWERMKR